MTYTWLTYAQARADIAQRLNDVSSVYWLNAGAQNEIGLLVKEALRTWQTLTGYWRARAVLNATANTTFYDLTAALNPAIRAYTVTDTEEIASMQYRLSENLGSPATGETWSGTAMFSLAQLTSALQEQRDNFLVQTGAVLKVYPNVPCTPAQARYPLPDDTVMDVRRLAWIDGTTALKTVLWRQDEWQMTAYNPGWSLSQGINPQSYSLAATPPLTFSLAPSPVATGAVELIATNTGAALNPVTGVPLGVPDDWANVVKWGALADLLSDDGPAPDPLRSQYCTERWESGLRLARVAPCIVALAINGYNVFPTTLWDMDMYNSGWENLTAGPNQLSSAGLNLVALSPGNNPTPPGITLDVIRNAPTPVVDADYLQVGREEWDAISGYCQHIACFKLGGDEFVRTLPLYKNFLDEAAVYTDRLAAYAPMAKPLSLQMHTECEKVHRRLTDSKIEVTTNASGE